MHHLDTGDDPGMTPQQTTTIRGGLRATRSAAAGIGGVLLVAACGQDPATQELNEFGIPVDPTGNMVVPVLIGLVLATVLLVGAAYVVWRLGREKDALPKPGSRDSWWTCGSCGTLNTADRDTCFACHASRPAGTRGSGPGAAPPTA